MPFEKFESKIEKKLERVEEEEKGREKIKDFIKETSENLKKEGVPVTEDCHIDIRAFSEIYPEKIIEKDQELVRDYMSEWYPGLSEEEIKKEKLKTDGEKLEMLITAIFAKNLGEDFIVARTSLYDDIKNKIDNIILEKETGNIVCALDEVAEISGERLEKKKNEILKERNIKEKGGKLKYGLKVEKDKKGKPKIFLSKIDSIPVFYLALDDKRINQAIENLIPSLEEKSEYEGKLFSYFKSSLNAQIWYLELDQRLHPFLKERLSAFKKSLQEFKK